MANSLYELSQEYLNALESIEIDEDTGEILNTYQLDEIEAAFDEKAEAVALYIKDLQAFHASLAQEIFRQMQRKYSTEARIKSLKEYLGRCLSDAGKDKLETAKTRISFRKSTAVVIDNEAVIPRDYFIEDIKTKINRTAIREAIKDGKTVQGAHIEDKKNIQII